jgi:hypothetical protein
MTVKFAAVCMQEVLYVSHNTRHKIAVINFACIVEKTFVWDKADRSLSSLLCPS